MEAANILDAQATAARAHKRQLELRIARATALRDLADHRANQGRGEVIAGFSRRLALSSVERYRSLKVTR